MTVWFVKIEAPPVSVRIAVWLWSAAIAAAIIELGARF